MAMLAFFFRHYERWVDRFYIYDDGSTDGTLDYLYAKPNVELRSFPRAQIGWRCSPSFSATMRGGSTGSTSMMMARPTERSIIYTPSRTSSFVRFHALRSDGDARLLFPPL